MQTFLPYPDFVKSAECLDYRRLNKQIVEAKQILTSLQTGKGWIHHPATKMWKNYEEALKKYHNVFLIEWIKRGYNNSREFLNVQSDFKLPHWFGNNDFHAAHRSNLLRKNFEFYSKFGWTESADLPYVWPI